MDLKGRGKRAQAAIDFLSSYGMALLVIAIALVIIYSVGTQSQYVFSSYCTPDPGFSCGFYELSTNGIMNITLAQATGGEIIVKGIACSSEVNNTKDAPKYGNIHVTNSIAYYPVSFAPDNGIAMYSGSASSFVLNCYDGTGIASGTAASSFVGSIWVNYSVYATNVVITQHIASVVVKYT